MKPWKKYNLAIPRRANGKQLLIFRSKTTKWLCDSLICTENILRQQDFFQSNKDSLFSNYNESRIRVIFFFLSSICKLV